MAQFNDCIHDALEPLYGLGQLNDLLLAFYKTNGGTSDHIGDACYEFLVAQGAAPGQLNDMWLEFLFSRGYTGSLNDMLHEFWCVGGGAVSLRAIKGWTGGEDCVEVIPLGGLLHQWNENSLVGDPVTQYIDRLTGLAATPAGGIPSNLVQTAVNGLPALQNLGGAFMVTPLHGAILNPVTVVLVASYLDADVPGDAARILDGRAGNSNRRIFFYDDTAGLFMASPSGQAGRDGFAYTPGTVAVFTLETNATNWWAYMDGVEVDVGTNTDQSFDPITFFADSLGVRLGQGIVCETLVYGRLLGAEEHAGIVSHLSAKWGVA